MHGSRHTNGRASSRYLPDRRAPRRPPRGADVKRPAAVGADRRSARLGDRPPKNRKMREGLTNLAKINVKQQRCI